ncbi:MAG: 50S ribosomal protein L20 [Halanaerobiales bacterium]
MPRVKRGFKARRRRKKILKMAKGYFGAKSKLYRPANQAVMKSLHFAYRDRRTKKRDFRRLWITRINAAARKDGMSYSRFISGLKQANIDIDRKMLADMAVKDENSFSELVDIAKEALNA